MLLSPKPQVLGTLYIKNWNSPITSPCTGCVVSLSVFLAQMQFMIVSDTRRSRAWSALLWTSFSMVSTLARLMLMAAGKRVTEWCLKQQAAAVALARHTMCQNFKKVRKIQISKNLHTCPCHLLDRFFFSGEKKLLVKSKILLAKYCFYEVKIYFSATKFNFLLVIFFSPSEKKNFVEQMAWATGPKGQKFLKNDYVFIWKNLSFLNIFWIFGPFAAVRWGCEAVRLGQRK